MGKEVIGKVQLAWKAFLQQASREGHFLSASKNALRLGGISEDLKTLNQQLSLGNFGRLPEVAVLPEKHIYGAKGAYSKNTGKIYLNQNWLRLATSEQVISVLNEELGHHLDAQFNANDTAGDEGHLFAILLSNGQKDGVSAELLNAIQIEEDHGTIVNEIGIDRAEFATIEISDVGSPYTGGNTADTINGTSNDDIIIGGDQGKGVAGDYIYGFGGSDTLSGGSGIDYIFGGGGADAIYGQTSTNTNDRSTNYLFGGEGNDYISSGKKNDVLRGDGNQQGQEVPSNAGKDELYGGNGHDLITGGDGNDFLHGGQGDDYLDGGQGADIIFAATTGGVKSSRTDHYFQHDSDSKIWSNAPVLQNSATLINGEVITFSNGVDVIYDFHHSDDQLYLPNTSFNKLTAGDQLSGLTIGANYFVQGTWSINDWSNARTNFQANNFSGSFTTGESTTWGNDEDFLVLYNNQANDFFSINNTNFLILDFDHTFANSSSSSEPEDMITDPNESLRQLPILIAGPTGNAGDNSVDFSLVENTTAVHTFTNATTGGTTYWSITGGDDSSLFSINETTGALAFNSAPDFDNPSDNDSNGIYDVIILATYSTGSSAWDRAVDYRSINVMQSLGITITSANINISSANNNITSANNKPASSSQEQEKPNQLLLIDNHSFKVSEGSGTGLWLQFKVTAANTNWQNSLHIVNQNGTSLGSIGATKSSTNLGTHELFIPEGSTLNFKQYSNNNPVNNAPQLTITESKDNFLLNLTDNKSSQGNDDLVIEISSSTSATDPASASIASLQTDIYNSILDLSSISSNGQHLTLIINSEGGYNNRIGFIKLDGDPSTGFKINNITADARNTFYQTIKDNIIDPSDSLIYTRDQPTQTLSWSLSPAEAGYYAPVVINPFGDVFTWGANSARDNQSHIKNLGYNFFAVEDMLSSNNPDWDYNDVTIQVALAY
ncbi:calcium-binding protein [Prochlorococcus marinus]|uniref:calcium-binding protein n=1 Tax=Prochlorococcus TaxID=1218 RepID=UPI0007B35347|nr:calcium-binding protein [Prochlorococcus marinus]KZR77102.1 Hemolysin, chromosomal [Prochlorococcus marinus str. MIT 1323]